MMRTRGKPPGPAATATMSWPLTTPAAARTPPRKPTSKAGQVVLVLVVGFQSVTVGDVPGAEPTATTEGRTVVGGTTVGGTKSDSKAPMSMPAPTVRAKPR